VAKSQAKSWHLSSQGFHSGMPFSSSENEQAAIMSGDCIFINTEPQPVHTLLIMSTALFIDGSASLHESLCFASASTQPFVHKLSTSGGAKCSKSQL